jgi:hypothetical protein
MPGLCDQAQYTTKTPPTVRALPPQPHPQNRGHTPAIGQIDQHPRSPRRQTITIDLAIDPIGGGLPARPGDSRVHWCATAGSNEAGQCGPIKPMIGAETTSQAVQALFAQRDAAHAETRRLHRHRLRQQTGMLARISALAANTSPHASEPRRSRQPDCGPPADPDVIAAARPEAGVSDVELGGCVGLTDHVQRVVRAPLCTPPFPRRCWCHNGPRKGDGVCVPSGTPVQRLRSNDRDLSGRCACMRATSPDGVGPTR